MAHTTTGLLGNEEYNRLSVKELFAHVAKLIDDVVRHDAGTADARRLWESYKDNVSWSDDGAVVNPDAEKPSLDLINKVEQQVHDKRTGTTTTTDTTTPPPAGSPAGSPDSGTTPTPPPPTGTTDDGTAPTWFTNWSTEQGNRLGNVEQTLNGTDDQPGLVGRVEALEAWHTDSTRPRSWKEKFFGNLANPRHRREH